MERKRLLYLISSDPQVSPFDINMAYDAGFDAVIPYASVAASAVARLVQDVMFSRGPKGARASAMFFSGSDLTRAEEMLAAARATLFDPFRIGLMVDPHGGYTTGAAIVARVTALARARGLGEHGPLRALVAAGTGGVGKTTAALLASEGTRVTLTSRRADSAEAAAAEVARLFAVKVTPRAASRRRRTSSSPPARRACGCCRGRRSRRSAGRRWWPTSMRFRRPGSRA